MARLEDNPDFVRRREELAHQQRLVEAQLRAEEEPLLAELADVGIVINSVWDLVNSKSAYTAAIPVLVRHLRVPYSPRIREGIIQSLAVPEARGHAGWEILEELKINNTSDQQVRWALANSLTVLADASMTVEIQSLISNPSCKDVRAILNTALKKMAV